MSPLPRPCQEQAARELGFSFQQSPTTLGTILLRDWLSENSPEEMQPGVSSLEKRLTCLPFGSIYGCCFLEAFPGCQLRREQGQMGQHTGVKAHTQGGGEASRGNSGLRWPALSYF